MSETFVNYKVVVPDNEIYEFKYDLNSAKKIIIGETNDKAEYATFFCEDGLIIFTNSAQREVWSNRKPKFNRTSEKTVVTFD